ncbi:MAG TPA: hypothetical protein VFC07_02560 [Verrucomicrobiae bacterium]|nr:hypothetical protein [Verrucomicrobiae bacterium]
METNDFYFSAGCGKARPQSIRWKWFARRIEAGGWPRSGAKVAKIEGKFLTTKNTKYSKKKRVRF